ncbi:MAG: peptidoglycan DD-metalloendopeptidase family protein [Pedobacter sp.]
MKLSKLLLLLFIIFFATGAMAQSSAELKRKKEALQREIDLLQKNANIAASSKKLTLGQINSLNAKIRLMQSKIGVINSEMKNLDNQIHENTNTVHTLKEQLEQLRKEYASMIRFAQRNRNAYDKMMFIFAASDFNQAYKRITYLQQFSNYRRKQSDYITGKEKDLSYKIVILDKNLRQKSSLLQEQENERTKLGRSKTEQAKVLNRFSREERQYKKDIAARRKVQVQLDRSIRSAIAREIEIERKKAEAEERLAAANANATPGSKPVAAAKSRTNAGYLNATPEAAKLSNAFESNRGSLPWPVAAGSITERFGNHMEGQASYTNDGVNIETAEGATVRAVFNGKVTTIRNQFGKYFVLIKHGEYFTVYQNLKSVSVSQGDEVTTKQNIGTVADNEGTPQLQFQVRRGMNAQNPEGWIAK